MFKQDGEIVSVGNGRGLERFDGNTAPHAHFVCTACSGVYDVPQDALRGIVRSAEQATGGEITAYQLSLLRNLFKLQKQQIINETVKQNDGGILMKICLQGLRLCLRGRSGSGPMPGLSCPANMFIGQG